MPIEDEKCVAKKQRKLQQTMRLDNWIAALDIALKTNFARPAAARCNPAKKYSITNTTDDTLLTAKQRKLSSSLMRVNHTGEVCAQALYTAQALTTRNPALQHHLKTAAQEEIDHLDWCRDRLNALGARSSILNPFWFAGAFTMGFLAGKLGGDKVSLGFVIETEKQVETHLASHLDRLPAADIASRAIVSQMKIDEVKHAQAAEKAGGIKLPPPVRLAMHLAGKIMTTTAQHI